MTESKNTLSEASQITFELENIGVEVARLGAGLDALAILMSASDPTATDGSSNNPILHGMGVLVEVVAARCLHYGEAAQQKSAELLRLSAKPPKIKTNEDEIAALLKFAREAVSETADE